MLNRQASRADDYDNCKATCAQAYADCVNEPPAPDSAVESAREATCNQKMELCNSDCENLKPVLDNNEPEMNPNIIVK
jgi:hypothetical protein